MPGIKSIERPSFYPLVFNLPQFQFIDDLRSSGDFTSPIPMENNYIERMQFNKINHYRLTIIIILITFILLIIFHSTTLRAETIENDIIVDDFQGYYDEILILDAHVTIKNGGTFVLDRCSIAVNGSIWVESGGELIINNTSLNYYKHTSGIFANRSSTVSFHKTAFDSNIVPFQFGDIYFIKIRTDNVKFINSVIKHGAFQCYFEDLRNINLSGLRIFNNYCLVINNCTNLLITNSFFISPIQTYPPEYGLYYGLTIRDARNVFISNCQFENYAFYHIRLLNSSKIHLDNITILGNGTKSIRSEGIHCRDCDDISVITTSVDRTTKNGILLEKCNNITVDRCELSFNRVGVNATESKNMNLSRSSISNHPLGIYLFNVTNSVAYLNNFYRNEEDVLDTGDNHWDSYQMGNYWDDYSGSDNDGDGIGDVPHSMPLNAYDRYPLMFPFEIEPLILLMSEPRDQESDVDVQRPLTLSFNLPVKRDSVVSSIDTSPNHELALLSISGNQNLWHVIIAPIDHWKGDTEYTVAIRSTIMDIFNRSLDRDYQILFRTSDISPPIITLISPKNNSWISPGVPIKIHVEELNLNLVKIETDHFKDVFYDNNVSIDTSEWADGSVTLSIRALDISNNIGIGCFTFMVDSEKPVILKLLPINRSHLGREAHFIVEVGDCSTTFISLTIGEETHTIQGRYLDIIMNDPKEGSLSAYLEVYDLAGNTLLLYLSYIVDLTPPSIILIEPQQYSVITVGDNIILSIFDDALNTIRHRINMNPWKEKDPIANGLMSITVDGRVEGAWVLSVEVTDFAGNLNTASFWYEVDTTPPSISYLPNPLPECLSPFDTILIEISDENIAEVRMLLNGLLLHKGIYFDIILELATLSDDDYHLFIEAKDIVGHETDVELSFRLDSVIPTIRVQIPEYGPYYSNQDEIFVMVQDVNIDLVNITLDNEAIDTGTFDTFSIPLEGWAYGWHSLNISARDKAKNANQIEFEIMIDNMAPMIRPLGFQDGGKKARGDRIGFQVDDDLDVSVSIRIDDGDWITLGYDLFYTLPLNISPGLHQIEIQANDIVGNSVTENFTLEIITMDIPPSSKTSIIISAIIACVFFTLLILLNRFRRRSNHAGGRQ